MSAPYNPADRARAYREDEATHRAIARFYRAWGREDQARVSDATADMCADWAEQMEAEAQGETT